MYKKILGLLLGALLLAVPQVWAVSSLHDIPGEHTISARIPATSSGSDASYAVAITPFRCTVVDVKITFDAAVTGAVTNNFTATMLDGGSDGTGTTVFASTIYTNNVDAAALNPETLTNSSTAADLNLAKDAVIIYKSDQTGSGLTDPVKKIDITIKAR